MHKYLIQFHKERKVTHLYF